MRVLLDTNVLIAALIAQGTCAELLERCLVRHEVVASDHILGELRRNLVRKMRLPAALVDQATRILRQRLILAPPVPVSQGVCRDPDDLPVLGTALAGRCHCLVTGDKDLLELRRFHQIDIIRPDEFWRYEARQEGRP